MGQKRRHAGLRRRAAARPSGLSGAGAVVARSLTRRSRNQRMGRRTRPAGANRECGRPARSGTRGPQPGHAGETPVSRRDTPFPGGQWPTTSRRGRRPRPRDADSRPRSREDMLARSLPSRKRGNDQGGRDARVPEGHTVPEGAGVRPPARQRRIRESVHGILQRPAVQSARERVRQCSLSTTVCSAIHPKRAAPPVAGRLRSPPVSPVATISAPSGRSRKYRVI